MITARQPEKLARVIIHRPRGDQLFQSTTTCPRRSSRLLIRAVSKTHARRGAAHRCLPRGVTLELVQRSTPGRPSRRSSDSQRSSPPRLPTMSSPRRRTRFHGAGATRIRALADAAVLGNKSFVSAVRGFVASARRTVWLARTEAIGFEKSRGLGSLPILPRESDRTAIVSVGDGDERRATPSSVARALAPVRRRAGPVRAREHLELSPAGSRAPYHSAIALPASLPRCLLREAGGITLSRRMRLPSVKSASSRIPALLR